jgi:hypothetical protein
MPSLTPARRDHPPAATPPQPPLTTPLAWAWGGVLLTATLWLTGILALVQSLGSLFD